MKQMDEKKDALLEQAMPPGTRELTDVELEQAAGGAGFKQCPHGHFEATGFANVLRPSKDCEVGVCSYFKRGKPHHTTTGNGFDIYDYNDSPNDLYIYKERCDFFNRELVRTDSSPKLKTNW